MAKALAVTFGSHNEPQIHKLKVKYSYVLHRILQSNSENHKHVKYYWNINFVVTNHKKDGTCQQATEPQTYYPVNQLDKIFSIPDNLTLNLAM